MPFPISIRNEVPLPREEEHRAAACDGIVEALERQGANVELRYQEDIVVKVPMFRGFRFAQLNNYAFVSPLDRIDLKCVETPEGPVLRYRLSMLRLVALTTLLMATFPLLARAQQASFPPLALIIVWVLTVGGNYLISMFRAKRFFRKLIAASNPAPATADVPGTPRLS